MNESLICRRSAMVVIGVTAALSMGGCSEDPASPADVSKDRIQRSEDPGQTRLDDAGPGETKPESDYRADLPSQDFVPIDVARGEWHDVRERIRREVVVRGGAVCIWSLSSEKLEMVGGRNSQANPLSVVGSESRLAVIGFELALFDMPSGENVGVHRLPLDLSLNAAVGASPTSGRVAYATGDQRIHCVDALTGRAFWSVPHSIKIAAGNYRFVFGPNDIYLALEGTPDRDEYSSSARDVVYLWNVQSGEKMHKIDGKFLTFSPDGKSIVVSDGEYTTRVAMHSIGSEEARLVYEEKDIRGPRFGWFAADGLLVIDSSGNRRSVELELAMIDCESTQVVRRVKLDALSYGDLWAVSSGGQHFARVVRNGTNDARVIVHDVESGAVCLDLDFAGSDPKNRGEVIGGVAFVGGSLFATTHPYVVWID